MKPLVRSLSLVAASALTSAVASEARAEIQILQNDGFVEDGSVGFQQGFVAGERGAVTLGPVAEGYQIRKVQLLFGPSGGVRTVNLLLYVDEGGEDPGTLLFEGEFEIQAAEDAMSELDVIAEDIQVAGGSIRVALEFQHDGSPSIARDDDGNIQPGRNWIYTAGQWFPSSTFGLSGDWVIRAEIDTIGGGTTSSTSATTSSGATTGSTGSGDATTGAGPTSTAASGGGTTSGAGGAAPACTPGDTQACVGIGACEGGQSCLPDGSGWSACECGDTTSSGAGGGDAAADGGGEDGCGCDVPGGAPGGGLAASAGLLALGALGASRRRRARPR